MLSLKELQAQYITNKTGKKVAIILPIEEFEELMEDIEDLAILAERRDEPNIPHAEVMAKLKSDGLL
jgi:PHD/YefM family antitoxin component YafN of YafNO toxin-antitoxin module